jgi:hypothetical protein
MAQLVCQGVRKTGCDYNSFEKGGFKFFRLLDFLIHKIIKAGFVTIVLFENVLIYLAEYFSKQKMLIVVQKCTMQES